MKSNRLIFPAASLLLVATASTLSLADNDTPSLDSVAVSVDQAIEIARSTATGDIIGIELENEDGQAIWEVELQSTDGQTELEIDALTGDVLEQELDDD